MQRGAGIERVDASGDAFGIGVNEQVAGRVLRTMRVAEGDHLAEFPARVDMKQRKTGFSGKNALRARCSMNAGILADRIQHHRLCGIRRRLRER
jgi:hypothetical protein